MMADPILFGSIILVAMGLVWPVAKLGELCVAFVRDLADAFADWRFRRRWVRRQRRMWGLR